MFTLFSATHGSPGTAYTIARDDDDDDDDDEASAASAASSSTSDARSTALSMSSFTMVGYTSSSFFVRSYTWSNVRSATCAGSPLSVGCFAVLTCTSAPSAVSADHASRVICAGFPGPRPTTMISPSFIGLLVLALDGVVGGDARAMDAR